MKYLVGVGLVVLLVVGGAVGEPIVLNSPDDATNEMEHLFGDLGCQAGCKKRPKNRAQLIGCVVAANSGEDEFANIGICARRLDGATCELEKVFPLCWWIMTPIAYKEKFGKGVCVPRTIVKDKGVLLDALEPYLPLFESFQLPSYLDIAYCLGQSGAEACSTSRDASKNKCATCDKIPETTFPMNPKVSSLCFRNDIAPKACNMIMEGPLEDCPVKLSVKVSVKVETTPTAAPDGEPTTTITAAPGGETTDKKDKD